MHLPDIHKKLGCAASIYCILMSGGPGRQEYLLLTAVAALQHGLFLRVGHHVLVREQPLHSKGFQWRSHRRLLGALRCLP